MNTQPVSDGASNTHKVIRECGGIVHSDGNIFFTNRYQFEHAASLVCGTATVAVPPPTGMEQDEAQEQMDRMMAAINKRDERIDAVRLWFGEWEKSLSADAREAFRQTLPWAVPHQPTGERE
jgi:hypothetical protein